MCWCWSVIFFLLSLLAIIAITLSGIFAKLGREIEEKRLPSFLSIAIRIIVAYPFKKRPHENLVVPNILIQCNDFHLKNKVGLLQEYKKMLNYEVEKSEGSVDSLSQASILCFMEVLFLPLQGCALCDPMFPLGGIALIHVRNEIRQYAPIRLEMHEEAQMKVSLGDRRWTPAGLEIEVVMILNLNQNGNLNNNNSAPPIWTCVATLLARSRNSSKPKTRKDPLSLPPPITTWNLPIKTGLEYAKLSGDWNPHHLYPITARLFGYPSPIAHGMYTLARSFADVIRNNLFTLQYPYVLVAEFKRPLLLPAKNVSVCAVSSSSSSSGLSQYDLPGLVPPPEVSSPVSFGVFSSTGVPHLRGYVAAFK